MKRSSKLKTVGGRVEGLRRSGAYCSVVGCSNNQGQHSALGVRFYRFPKDERKELWEKAIKRVDSGGRGRRWLSNPSSQMCSVHFYGGAKSDEKGSPAYVPTIFPTNHGKEAKEADEARYKRVESRRKSQEVKEPTKSNTSRTSGLIFDNDQSSYVSDKDKRSEASSQTLDFGIRYGGSIRQWIHERYESSLPGFCELSTMVVISHCNDMDVQTDELEKNETSTNTEPFTHKIVRGLLLENLSDKQFIAFTGLSRNIFQFVRHRIGRNLEDSRVLSANQKLELVLVKLKLNQSFRSLAAMFGISGILETRIIDSFLRTQLSEQLASRTFGSTLDVMSLVLQPFVKWLTREVIRARMPTSFRGLFPRTRAIIDCSEVECENTPKVRSSVLLYSQYKGRHTIKFLVACAPSGEITFISNAFGGRSTDTEVTNQSGFLELLEPGDEIMSDKGFPKIETKVNEAGAVLVMPPFKQTKKQFTKKENEQGYKIASVRIHVERCIGRMKVYDILHRVHSSMMPYIDKVLIVIAAICNLKDDLIQE